MKENEQKTNPISAHKFQEIGIMRNNKFLPRSCETKNNEKRLCGVHRDPFTIYITT